MWDYESFIGKAQTYFSRAEEHTDVTDDEFALWVLLGLEFLLRAPLARVHPSLLASPEGDSILFAAGVLTSGDPKSIPVHTVIDRLSHVVGLDKDRQNDARQLVNLRNSELHSGAAVLATIKTELWLPKFIRVAEELCVHLGLHLSDVVGKGISDTGRALVDAEDKKLLHIVQQKIAAASKQVQSLAVGRPNVSVSSGSARQAKCPSCSDNVDLSLDLVRITNEHVEDDEYVKQVVEVAVGLLCGTCGLQLDGTAEIKAAGLEQQYVREVRENVSERVLSDYYADDYGND